MSEQVNGVNIPSIQNQKPVNFQQAGLTPMQGVPVDTEALKQAANDSYISSRVKASQDDNPFVKLGFGLGIWYGLGQLMDKINPMMGGDFEKSLGGKVAAVGDKFAKTRVGKFIDGMIEKASKGTDRLAENSKIVNSLKHHSTSPEWGFAKVPAKGLFGFWSMDAGQVLENYIKPIESNVQKLEQYGLKQNEIDDFVKTLSGKSKEAKNFLIQEKELALLNGDSKIINNIKNAAKKAAKKEAEDVLNSPNYAKILEKLEYQKQTEMLQRYATHLKVKDMGIFKNVYQFKNFKFIDNPEKSVEIFDNLAKKHPNWKISRLRNKTTEANGWFTKGVKTVIKAVFGENAANKVTKFLNSVGSHFVGRTVGFTEYRNKGLIATGKGGATRLGRLMSKSMGWFMEGSTNRFGGGKLIVAMQAFIFAEMAMATLKAPWGEKFKTGVERVVNDFSYFIGGTLGLIGMHKIGGFKYAGLKDKAAIDAYNEARKALNAKNDAGLFASKKDWKAAVKELNDVHLGRANIKNPITRLLQRIGVFINIGNERVHSYKSTAKYNLNWLRKIKNGNIIGVPLRIWLGMGVAVPFIAKWATKGVHAIFGRPTHSVLDEEETVNETPQTASQPQQTAQQAAAVPAVAQASQAQVQNKSAQDYQSNTNLIKQAMNGKQNFTGNSAPNSYSNYQDSNFIKMTLEGKYPQNNANPQTGNAAQNVNQTDVQKELEPKRTYIPSAENKIKVDVDTTAADKALADAENAEKFINDTLAQIK